MLYRQKAYYALDLSGNVMAIYNELGNTKVVTQQELPIFGTGRLGVYKRVDGSCSYQITDHLGNVRAVMKKTSTGVVSVLSYADYYPYGEQLTGRNTQSDYRYAFQGQELDKETGMEAFQLRLWDGRIGRWLSKDPKEQYSSPYLGMGNNPISMIDKDGGVAEPPVNGLEYFKDNTGEYFWNNTDNNYEVFKEGSYSGRYVADKFSEPVGDYTIIFDLSNAKGRDEYDKSKTINSLVVVALAGMEGGTFKNISNQSKYPGVIILSSPGMNGALTAGNVIFTNPGMEADDDLDHEYGHYLDYKYHFKFNQADYIKSIGIPSFISATMSTIAPKHFIHDNSETEKRANRLGGAWSNNTTLKNLYRK